MKILLIGSGGREHALAYKISESKKLSKLFIAPGNAGTSTYGENVSINISDFSEIKDFVLSKSIEMVIVGPEAPLADGISDFFANNSLLEKVKMIGPGKLGATLESSKDFAKEFMLRHNIPTAAYKTFNGEEYSAACDFLKTMNPPYVLKADGLAAGKGVVIVNKIDEAKATLKSMFDGEFGNAGNKVVIEQFLDGVELSVFALTDGTNYVLLPEAKDYKRIGEGDTGLNTGGMGSISPVPFADEIFMQKVENQIVKPTIEGLILDKIPYTGFLFFGLINVNGSPFVIEYNVRMGDPETESVMPRIDSDFLELLDFAAKGELAGKTIKINPDSVASIMMVSGGYPGKYEKGEKITGLDNHKDCILFHAGTKKDDNGNIVTNGGRVIAVTAFGKNLKEAIKNSYNCVKSVNFNNSYYRTDLGKDIDESV